MSDILGGIGAAAEGGLLSRALEPESGAKARHPDQPDNCLNCETPLVGAYCHACGQQGHIHRTIGAFMHDLLHGALHFEGKLWHTLPLLTFRPGRLTRRYIEGQRARFVSPMALFLFGVFLMFAVFQVVGLTAPSGLKSPNVAAAIEAVEKQATEERDAAREALEELPADADNRAELEERLDEAQTALDGMSAVDKLELEKRSGMTFSATGIEWIDEKLLAKWRQDPNLMVYKLTTNAYKFSWLLIPISIPFVWLLFAWKRRFKAYDHAIFVTYSLSFMTLLFIAGASAYALGASADMIGLAIMLIPPIHLYKQLRGAYELRRFSAFWRLMVLSIFIWIVIALFLQLLLVLGAF